MVRPQSLAIWCGRYARGVDLEAKADLGLRSEVVSGIFRLGCELVSSAAH